MTQLAFESATTLVAKIKAKEITSRALLEMYFERVDAHNGELNAIIIEVRERAIALSLIHI